MKRPDICLSRRTFLGRSLLLGTALLGIRWSKAWFLSDALASSFRPRVVEIHHPSATSWDYRSYPYVDFIDQKIINEMVRYGIQQVSNIDNPYQAWKKIMRNYRSGHRIAIKPNLNGVRTDFKEMMTTPQVINAVLRELVTHLNVSPFNIYIFDISQHIPSRFKKTIVYPVNFVEGWGGDSVPKRLQYKIFGNPLAQLDLSAEIAMRADIVNAKGNHVKCYIPKVLSEVQHIINIPALKSHIFLGTSCALKNHFGSVTFSDRRGTPAYLHNSLHTSITDINLNPHIKDKTRLIVGDALLGAFNWRGQTSSPQPWSTLKEGQTPNRIFISQDPVAIESIMLDLITQERVRNNLPILPHIYLHDAMEKGLGVHEHKNSNHEYQMIDHGQFHLR